MTESAHAMRVAIGGETPISPGFCFARTAAEYVLHAPRPEKRPFEYERVTSGESGTGVESFKARSRQRVPSIESRESRSVGLGFPRSCHVPEFHSQIRVES